MPELGTIGTLSKIVTEDMTARKIGSGELDVLATPAMIALIEETAWRSVADSLDSGMGTVGTKLNIAHTAATPIGMEISCKTKLIEIDRRRLVFEVTVSDAAGEIGCGTHERFIVDNARFQEKTNSKAINS